MDILQKMDTLPIYTLTDIVVFAIRAEFRSLLAILLTCRQFHTVVQMLTCDFAKVNYLLRDHIHTHVKPKAWCYYHYHARIITLSRACIYCRYVQFTMSYLPNGVKHGIETVRTTSRVLDTWLYDRGVLLKYHNSFLFCDYSDPERVTKIYSRCVRNKPYVIRQKFIEYAHAIPEGKRVLIYHRRSNRDSGGEQYIIEQDNDYLYTTKIFIEQGGDVEKKVKRKFHAATDILLEQRTYTRDKNRHFVLNTLNIYDYDLDDAEPYVYHGRRVIHFAPTTRVEKTYIVDLPKDIPVESLYYRDGVLHKRYIHACASPRRWVRRYEKYNTSGMLVYTCETDILL